MRAPTEYPCLCGLACRGAQHAWIAMCLSVYVLMGKVSMAATQIPGSRGDLIHPSLPRCPSRSRQRGTISPGIRMALELLLDVPEEVVLRQEEGGAQSQELPALGGRKWGVSAGSACHRPHGPELQSHQQPLQTTAPNLLWAPGGPAWPGSVRNRSHAICVRTSRRGTEKTAGQFCAPRPLLAARLREYVPHHLLPPLPPPGKPWPAAVLPQGRPPA